MKHNVVAVPVRKMDSGSRIIAWRFSCSCGREGKGWHATPDRAIERGHDHVKETSQ